MVVDAAGGAYVGNFGLNVDEAVEVRGNADVVANPVAAKLAYISPDGGIRVAADDMHFPNGSIITPDGRTLIVNDREMGISPFGFAGD